MRVLTLGKGDVGNPIHEELSSRDDIVAAQASRSTEAGYKFDITSSEEVRAILADFQPDIIINSAQLASFSECDKDPALAQAVNVDGAQILLEAMKTEAPGSQLLQLSSVAVFAGNKEKPYTPGDDPNAKTVYGQTLAQAEQLVLKAGLEHSVVRTVHVWGETVKTAPCTLSMMMSALQSGSEFTAYDDNLVGPTFAADLAQAFVLLLKNKDRLPGIIHAAGSPVGSTYELCEQVQSVIGGSLESITKGKVPRGGQKNSVLDHSGLRTWVTGLSPSKQG